MDKRPFFDNYLTSHYSNCEKIDLNDDNSLLELLDKNVVVINRNLGNIFKRNVSLDSKVLDLGCGYGSFIKFLQNNFYSNVTGVDLSGEELAVCRKLFPEYRFYQQDIEDYARTNGEKYDVIYLSHVLEHIEKVNLSGFLRDMKSLLNDGGYLIIIVPNSAAYFNAMATRYGDITHEVGFTNNNLNQLLLVAGFNKFALMNYYGTDNVMYLFIRKMLLLLFEMLIRSLGYDKQKIYTPSLLAIIQK